MIDKQAQNPYSRGVRKELVSLQPGVVILREDRKKDGVHYSELPLSEIPDEQAENIQTAIEFILTESARGNFNASGTYTYQEGNAELRKQVTYKVVSINSPFNINRSPGGDR